MQVLKKGRKQKGWSRKFTCTGSGNGGGGCGAVLLVSAGDFFQTASHHYDGSSEYYTTFECPECGVLTDAEGVPVYPTIGHREWKQCQRHGD